MENDNNERYVVSDATRLDNAKRAAEWRKNNPNKVKDTNGRYRMSVKGKEAAKASSKRYRERNKQINKQINDEIVKETIEN